jgi:phosphomannomutase
MVNNLVIGTLQGLGIDVIDLGLSTTPTVEVAVPDEKAAVVSSLPPAITLNNGTL